MNNYIIYFHYPCNDGLVSLWIATKKLVGNIKSIPFTHGKTVIDTSYIDKTIYFLDMVPSIEIYHKLKENNIVYILDHHKSNERDYNKIDDKNVYFDMKLSGAGLAWNYFFPEEPMPKFVRLIQARDPAPPDPRKQDLFDYTVEDEDMTNQFIESFNLYCYKQNLLDKKLEVLDNIDVDKFIEYGKILLDKKKEKIRELTDKYINNIYLYEGFKVCMVNVDYEYASDLGASLSKHPNCDFAILWSYDHITEDYRLSLRSNNKADVSIISKKFGGGGHMNAAGYNIKEHPQTIFGLKKLILL
jgi:oligoribonuclease NrnB/cAMP/cGMP phosphodiesterase (DHH superfamily)